MEGNPPIRYPQFFVDRLRTFSGMRYDFVDKNAVDCSPDERNGIAEIKPDGILLSDGSFYPVEVIALATGFDAVTGSMVQMGIKNIHGKYLEEEWGDGAMTYLGLCHSDYPNVFFLYGVHCPTSYSNGPSSIAVQEQWIVDAIRKMEATGIRYIDPLPEAEKLWKHKINELSDRTLFPLANSWYMRANIPGKKREQLSYGGGIPLYEQECKKALSKWRGFTIA
ncbi:hypothetical protein VTO42DRAFT_6855 [Malbranchea cinnamomea]